MRTRLGNDSLDAAANPFCAAYLNGKNMQPDDPWLQSSVSNVLDQPRRPGKS